MAKGTKPLSCRETSLIVAVALLFIVCTVLVVLVAIHYGTSQWTAARKNGARRTNRKMCLTAECVELAGRTLTHMNLSVDPCEDFYEYVCGKFRQKTLLKHDEPIRDLGGNSIIPDTNERLLTALTTSDTRINGKQSTAVQKAIDVYESCLNATTETTQKNDAAALQQFIDSLGGWPLSGTFDPRLADVELTAAKVTENGGSAILQFDIAFNFLNISKFMISVSSTPGMDPSVYNKSGQAATTKTAIESLAKLLGGDVSAKASVIADMVDIEKALVKLYRPPLVAMNLTLMSNILTLADIQGLVGPNFQVGAYLRNLLGYSVSPRKELVGGWPKDLPKLRYIFDGFSEESLIAYMVWSVVKSRLPFLAEPFAELLGEKLTFTQMSCLTFTTANFHQVLGALYVEDYYDKSYTAMLNEMMVRIRQAFIDNLDSVDWMDDVSKKKSIEKMRAMKYNISYYDLHVDAELLDRAYQFYGPFAQDDLFGNINNIFRAKYKTSLDRLGKRPTIVQLTFDDAGPSTANAFYQPLMNTMMTWAGITQYAFYDEGFLSAMAYGSLGFILGHELTHGFDTDGMKHDKNGNLRQWMSDASLAGFNERTKCLVDQFSKYEVLPEITVDGTLTLAENIADNGGIKLAFEAYRNWEKARGDGVGREPLLPGLGLTNEQVFFVAMAMPWCTKETEAAAKILVVTDNHSPGRYRILGTLSNYDQFSKTFNCPIGSYMNPKDRCIVW